MPRPRRDRSLMKRDEDQERILGGQKDKQQPWCSAKVSVLATSFKLILESLHSFIAA